MIKKGGLEERSKDIFSQGRPEEKFRGEIIAGKVKSTFWAQFLDLRHHLKKPSGLRRIYFVITFSLLLLSASGCGREKASLNEPWPTSSEMMRSGVVKPGIEILLEKNLDKLRAKKVGLITNPTGVDSNLVSTIERLRSLPEVKLVALYGPEHGVRGNAQAGEYVPFYVDEKYGLPVFSLYGQSMKPPQDMLLHLDEFMRNFDTTEAGKIPEQSMVKEIEVMLFDLQDVGTRVYTYCYYGLCHGGLR